MSVSCSMKKSNVLPKSLHLNSAGKEFNRSYLAVCIYLRLSLNNIRLFAAAHGTWCV